MNEDMLRLELRRGFALIAAAILRVAGSSDDAMTVESATRLARRLQDDIDAGV